MPLLQVPSTRRQRLKWPTNGSGTWSTSQVRDYRAGRKLCLLDLATTGSGVLYSCGIVASSSPSIRIQRFDSASGLWNLLASEPTTSSIGNPAEAQGCRIVAAGNSVFVVAHKLDATSAIATTWLRKVTGSTVEAIAFDMEQIAGMQLNAPAINTALMSGGYEIVDVRVKSGTELMLAIRYRPALGGSQPAGGMFYTPLRNTSGLARWIKKQLGRSTWQTPIRLAVASTKAGCIGSKADTIWDPSRTAFGRHGGHHLGACRTRLTLLFRNS